MKNNSQIYLKKKSLSFFYFLRQLSQLSGFFQEQSFLLLRLIFILLTLLIATDTPQTYAFQSSFSQDLIPSDINSSFYYRIGGGREFSLPPVEDTSILDLGAKADLGAVYRCGAFNPAVSLSHTLNEMIDSLKDAEAAIVQHLTAAIGELPMYELARANPTLYNILNNKLLGAEHQIELATKSCEEMDQQISEGINPYRNWATLSVDQSWKKQIGIAELSGEGNVTEAKREIETHSGDEGVPWINGYQDHITGQFLAGGKGQPPIHIISDTSIAGYNVLLGRDPADKRSPTENAQNQHLLAVWPTPQEASLWITTVVGDKTITTCTHCQKGSQIGRGLAPFITVCSSTNYCADNMAKQLSALVHGNVAITQERLTALSSPGLTLSPAVINAIQSLDKTEQAIVIDKLGQEMAVQQVMDRAFLARRLLLTGSQVPEIAANHLAQREIMRAIHQLDDDIRNFAFEQHMRQQLVSNTLSAILTETHHQKIHSVVNPLTPFDENSMMQGGAVSSKGEQP